MSISNHHSVTRTALGILAAMGLLLSTLLMVTPVFADGNDSSAECTAMTINADAEHPGQSEDEVTVDAGAGFVVTAICIKSGDDAFGDKQHSGVIDADGTYADCYTVEGIGTQTVTVTTVDSSDCKGISHVDAATSESASESPSESASESPSESASESPSESASESPSESASESPSESASESPSEPNDLGESGRNDNCPDGDYFKIESTGVLLEGTHDYVGVTKDGHPFTATLTVVFDEDNEVESITVVDTDPDYTIILFKAGTEDYWTTGPVLVAANGKAISNVTFCFGLVPSESPSESASPSESEAPSESASPSESEAPSESESAAESEAPSQSVGDGVMGGNPTSTPGGGTLPDTALGSSNVPAWPFALLFLMSLSGLLVLRLTTEEHRSR